jgi:hypothetical protein
LRRAIEHGDAWIPFGLRLDQLATMLHDPAVRERLARYSDDHGRPLGLVFAPELPIDPLGEPDRTAEVLASYIAVGATGFSLRFDQKSPAHCCEQMAALQALVRSTGWSAP